MSNTLDALKKPGLFSLFEKMLAHRYRTDILRDYYGLGEIPASFTWGDRQVTPSEKAHLELAFLRDGSTQSANELDSLVEQFWWHCRPHEDHLQEHLAAEEKYNEIAVMASDLKLVKPLFYLFQNHSALDIADIGAGKNRLGKAILESFDGIRERASYMNWIDHAGGPPTVSVVGTDVVDWHDPATDEVTGLEYRLQPSPTVLPLENESRDVAITKWCFHHMNSEEIHQQIENIFKILRPGGVVLVIEAFLSDRDSLPAENGYSDLQEPTYHQRLLEVSRRIEFADLWPEGPWKSECFEITRDYLALPIEDQRSILALEDFFGHYVLNQRVTMPFPFSYLPAEDLIKRFVSAGFIEQRWNFQFFGLAPVIRRGPPSARFVFQKPTC